MSVMNDMLENEYQLKQEIESLRQQLDDHIKREVMLRDALETCEVGDFSTGHVIYPSFDEKLVNEALAATDDLDGLILCDAVEVGWIGTGPRDRRCEFSESKPANSVMRDFNMKPLYRAWEPK